MESIVANIRQNLINLPAFVNAFSDFTHQDWTSLISGHIPAYLQNLLASHGLAHTNDADRFTDELHALIRFFAEHPPAGIGMPPPGLPRAPPSELTRGITFRSDSGLHPLASALEVPSGCSSHLSAPRRIRRHANFRIFNRLSPEMLLEIFWQAAQLQPGYQVVLSHVCRKWRHLLLHTPRFWTDIVIDGYHSLEASLEYMKRSKFHLLDVHLRDSPVGRFSSDNHSVVVDMIEVLLIPELHFKSHAESELDDFYIQTKPDATFMQRVRTLKLRVDYINRLAYALQEMAAVAASTVDPLPLRKLDVSVVIPPTNVPGLALQRWTIPPQLHNLVELSLDRMVFQVDGMLPNLRHLSISRPAREIVDIGTIYELLAICPSLVSADFDEVVLTVQDGEFWPKLHLPALERLAFRKGRSNAALVLLDWLDAPGLTQLEIDVNMRDQTDRAPYKLVHSAILVQIARFCSVKELRLGGGHFEGDDLFDALSALTCLERLVLSHCQFNGSAFERLADAESAEAFPCKRLRSVKLSHCSGFAPRAIKRLVHDRKLRASQGWIARIDELAVIGCTAFTKNDAMFCAAREVNVEYKM